VRKASIRNKYVLTAVVIAAAAGIVAGAYAAAPLSRLFNGVSDSAAASKSAETPGDKVAARVMQVAFGAAVKGMPWSFRPLRPAMQVRVGEPAVAYFQAANEGSRPMTGAASFSVTPLAAAQYFDKVQCFCINEQTLQPGESANLPVTFFIDPAIENDHSLDGLTTFTLSYTYHPVPETERKKPEQVSRSTTGGTTGKLD
jgi:cytochrome c oxidase assembly protein subunit 11